MRCIHLEQGGHSRENELSWRKRIVLHRRGGDVRECTKDECFASHKTSLVSAHARLLARYTSTTSLLLTGGITPDG
jgi:hypothetical protein